MFYHGEGRGERGGGVPDYFLAFAARVLESEKQCYFPAGVVTRAIQRKLEARYNSEGRIKAESRSESRIAEPLAGCVDLSDAFIHRLFNADHSITPQAHANTRSSILQTQHENPEIAALFSEALDSNEEEKVVVCYNVGRHG